MTDLTKAYRATDPSVEEIVAGPDGVQMASDGTRSQVVLEIGPASASASSYHIGTFKVAIITNLSNTAERLTTEQLGSILRGQSQDLRWSQFGGSGGVIRCYGMSKACESAAIIRQNCMRFVKKDKVGFYGGWYAFRKDLNECAGSNDVIKQVQSDQNGIGFVLYDTKEIKGVKVLGIGDPDGKSFVMPSVGDDPIDGYVLSESLFLTLPKGAGPAAKSFCEFAIGPVGSEIAERNGMITAAAVARIQGMRRLADVRAGKGVAVTGAGTGGGGRVLSESVEEYVKVKAALRMSYAPTESDVTAIGSFFSSEGNAKEFVILADKPGERAMQAHGQKWNELQAEENMLAGRAVAIIVNPTSKLESMTLDQVRGIFSGDTTEWSALGGAKGPIKCFGLLPADPAAQVFYRECLPAERLKKVAVKKDTAEAVAAVSMDAGAIAFVDLAAIPGIGSAALTGNFTASGQSIKVLGIKLGQGDKGEKTKVIWPTAENIKSAMYPFSQRLYLYVHPKASDTAKDFAKFLATCGGSEAQPYADTVKAMMETYQKHGLIPLADAALQRAAKDTMRARAKEAAKEAAGIGGKSGGSAPK